MNKSIQFAVSICIVSTGLFNGLRFVLLHDQLMAVAAVNMFIAVLGAVGALILFRSKSFIKLRYVVTIFVIVIVLIFIEKRMASDEMHRHRRAVTSVSLALGVANSYIETELRFDCARAASAVVIDRAGKYLDSKNIRDVFGTGTIKYVAYAGKLRVYSIGENRRDDDGTSLLTQEASWALRSSVFSKINIYIFQLLHDIESDDISATTTCGAPELPLREPGKGGRSSGVAFNGVRLGQGSTDPRGDGDEGRLGQV